MFNGKLARMLLVFLFCALFTTINCGAQVTTAGIEGTVKDQSGAVVPHAAVTVRSMETGTSRTTVADDAGRYIIPQLAVGNYEAQAEQSGFRTEVHKGIILTVGRDAVVDFTLAIGEVS